MRPTRRLPARSTVVRTDLLVPPAALAHDLCDRMQRYWQAANYLTIGQIYLQDNPLLREPLRPSTSSRACSATGARRPA